MANYNNFHDSNTSSCSFASAYGNEEAAALDISDRDFLEWFHDAIPAAATYNPHPNYTTPNIQLFDEIANISLRDGPIINRNNGGVKETREIRDKVAFKTKSEIEVLDDGFKWRKYGKKMVKNNQYPRNYYKCSVEGCPVKKRVERDNEDRRYVLTTYEGIHNHVPQSK